jgi:hypothetical protein
MLWTGKLQGTFKTVFQLAALKLVKLRVIQIIATNVLLLLFHALQIVMIVHHMMILYGHVKILKT